MDAEFRGGDYDENDDPGQTPEGIREAALILDNALEDRDFQTIESCFSDGCRIEILGVELTGKAGVRKWLSWMFSNVSRLKLTPVTMIVDGNIYFEEFVLRGWTKDGTDVESRQSEVQIYENYKVKELRLYFDRLDFAKSTLRGSLSRFLVNRIIKISTKNL